MELFHGGLKVGGPIALATVRDWLQNRVGLSPAVQMHLLVTIIVIAGLWIIERLILAVVYRRGTAPGAPHPRRQTHTHTTPGIGVPGIGVRMLAGLNAIR